MNNSMEIGTSTQHFPQRTIKDRQNSSGSNSKKVELVQEKLRRLQEVMAPRRLQDSLPPGSGNVDQDRPLRAAVRHLHQTRETRRRMTNSTSQGPSWTPHHTNYTAGYMDSVRDVNRVLVNSPDLHPATRSDLSHFISIKQDYNRMSQQVYNQPGAAQCPPDQQVNNNPNNRYNFFYPAATQQHSVPTVPYTYWKPW